VVNQSSAVVDGAGLEVLSDSELSGVTAVWRVAVLVSVSMQCTLIQFCRMLNCL
jgi:hypothetical protein